MKWLPIQLLKVYFISAFEKKNVLIHKLLISYKKITSTLINYYYFTTTILTKLYIYLLICIKMKFNIK